jgi:hypothetical protein
VRAETGWLKEIELWLRWRGWAIAECRGKIGAIQFPLVDNLVVRFAGVRVDYVEVIDCPPDGFDALGKNVRLIRKGDVRSEALLFDLNSLLQEFRLEKPLETRDVSIWILIPGQNEGFRVSETHDLSKLNGKGSNSLADGFASLPGQFDLAKKVRQRLEGDMEVLFRTRGGLKQKAGAQIRVEISDKLLHGILGHNTYKNIVVGIAPKRTRGESHVASR